jgi:hypothetical protein
MIKPTRYDRDIPLPPGFPPADVAGHIENGGGRFPAG